MTLCQEFCTNLLPELTSNDCRWGSGKLGRLGHCSDSDEVLPRKIALFSHSTVRPVRYSTACLSTNVQIVLCVMLAQTAPDLLSRVTSRHIHTPLNPNPWRVTLSAFAILSNAKSHTLCLSPTHTAWQRGRHTHQFCEQTVPW